MQRELSGKDYTTIAEILSGMDAEIAALEGKLSKAREVKAGMMSVLLTGRIRLVDDSGKLKMKIKEQDQNGRQ